MLVPRIEGEGERKGRGRPGPCSLLSPGPLKTQLAVKRQTGLPEGLTLACLASILGQEAWAKLGPKAAPLLSCPPPVPGLRLGQCGAGPAGVASGGCRLREGLLGKADSVSWGLPSSGRFSLETYLRVWRAQMSKPVLFSILYFRPASSSQPSFLPPLSCPGT